MSERITARRTVALFCAMLMLFCGLISRMLMLITESDYVEAAASQSTYRITVGNSRGRIYDCKMRSLAGGRMKYRAVIEPSSETLEHLAGVLSADEMVRISDQLTGRSPFLYSPEDATISGPGVRVYRCEERYGSNSLAKHIVGYLNGSGDGVSGIERACNNYLTECSGEITAYHTINSGGRSLSGIEPVVNDTTYLSAGGVVLTIDMDIQQIAEKAADMYLERGAIVIIETDSGCIRASVSRPEFDQNDIAASLDYDDGRLVNRAISAYDIGSVFKLAAAAAALEKGISENTVFLCSGSIEIGDNTFHCSNRAGHGEIDMREAVSYSCNIYFIELAKLIGAEQLLEYAQKLGFGKAIVLGEGYSTDTGCLPNTDILKNPAALANFSFGQGELMASPMHIALMIAAIANDGIMPEHPIVAGMVTPYGERFGESVTRCRRVMSSLTAEKLRSFMLEAVQNGTGRAGASDYVLTAAKTGTAQTGIIRDGKAVLQAWYAGFFPYEQPKYACVVLFENGRSGGADAGPVFRYIADELCC